jgi:hypothetical protein
MQSLGRAAVQLAGAVIIRISCRPNIVWRQVAAA